MTASVTLAQHPRNLKGRYRPPGDKSISHRAVMFGALSSGRSVYTHFLQAEDCLHTLQAFQAMGVSASLDKQSGTLTIDGVGIRGLKAPDKELYLGNSGTSMRLMLGILSGQRFEAVLSGDPSLSSRPMKRVTVPLKSMGAQIKGKDNGNFAPLTIRGGKLKAIEFENHLKSAQVKSAILFAGLYAEGVTRIHEPVLSRDHSERFLQSAGASFRKNGEWLEIEATESIRALSGAIPGDMSSAAFFLVGAAMTPGSELMIEGVCLNPTRTGVLNVLERMGASVEIEVTQREPEPLGNVYVKGARLKGTRVMGDEVPSLIDELPILMTAMALAEGESLVSGAEELRVKETDRILSMAKNLNALGGRVEELPDGCLIRGVEGFQGASVESFGDHRTAMSMAIATLAMKGELTILDTDCVATSFPGFFADFDRLKA